MIVCVSAINPLPRYGRTEWADSEYRRLRLALFHATPPVRVLRLAETHVNEHERARARSIEQLFYLPSTQRVRSWFASTAVMCAPRFPRFRLQSTVFRRQSRVFSVTVSPPSTHIISFRRFRAVRRLSRHVVFSSDEIVPPRYE